MATPSEKLSNENDDDLLIGYIIESAIRATKRAYEEARKTNIPVYFSEGEILYSIDSKGNKKYIKEIKKPTEKYPSQFKLT